MSKFTEGSLFFKKRVGSYADGWGEVTDENRNWEDAYRDRWAHDKIVRSTHGVNCTGSCSWKIYVKDGIVTWETQQTDYPPTPCGVPNHEPRGCPRGAGYSWYLYSAARVKHPLIRAQLRDAWRRERAHHEPLEAWKRIVEDPETRESYVKVRGMGDLVRTSWDEATEIIAAANLYTIEKYGPDRIAGFSPIPGYSMVSYGAGIRYLSLIGGAALSFYDWYCDLPPSSPQTFGEQTDVPESEAWYYSNYILCWGTNISMTRTPDAHFMIEARYNGTKLVNICPDYCESTKDADWWLHPKQGTDAAMALAMNFVIFKEFHLDNPDPYFTDYVRKFTDLPMLVCLDKRAGKDAYVAGRTLRASDLEAYAKAGNGQWKTVVWDETSNTPAVPQGSIGYRWEQEANGDEGKWNTLEIDGETGKDIHPRLSFIDSSDEVVTLNVPYFGDESIPLFPGNTDDGPVLERAVPAKKIKTTEGEMLVTTVFDLFGAYLGIDRGIGGQVAKGEMDNVPFTPRWQQDITGVRAEDVIRLAREFATAASATKGRACVLMGAGLNQWYQTDNAYRGIMNILMLCGTVGVPGGGWCHYVGQEKIRPEAGWAEFSFAQDWFGASRQMNATSYFYEHADQWRYERMPLSYMRSPLADPKRFSGTYLDYNLQSSKMGWLPTAPELDVNPIKIAEEAKKNGQDTQEYLVDALKSGKIHFSLEDLDEPFNWPRNLFVWRSNILGSSGKGQEYFLKHLMGAQDGIVGEELTAEEEDLKPELVKWREAPVGKLDLLVNLDFRMSTTSLYSDIVLPAATFYEKNDINTTDMHSFIHPFVKAVSCPWEAKSDWEIFELLAKRISQLGGAYPERFGAVKDVLLTPLGHDTASELGQPLEVKRWYEGECDLIPGKTAPHIVEVERNYANIHDMYCSVGPRLSENGGGNRGIKWGLDQEIEELAELNGTMKEGVAQGRPKMDSDIAAANMIMRVSPETNGSLAYNSWDFVEKQSGVPCKQLSEEHRGDKLTFFDLQIQSRKTFTAPDWSGTENDEIPYIAFWQNINLNLPWRTLTGRQHFYQDHEWMRAFGQEFPQYRPPADQRALAGYQHAADNGHPTIMLNFTTVHQKWGIHSTYYDNERMLSLSRGGPTIWLNDKDAKAAGIEDNDWVEFWNANGAMVARAILTSRMPEGLSILQHATEKIMNTPASKVTGIRGGDHNSPTRVVINPTHMIGGYAQLSFHLNYYGTICPNRDDFIWLHKLDSVEWLDEEAETEADILTKRVVAKDC